MYRYHFRGLHCNIVDNDHLWCVSGQLDNGGGILEWCYDKEDAEFLLKQMKKDSRMSNLRAHKYNKKLDIFQ